MTKVSGLRLEGKRFQSQNAREMGRGDLEPRISYVHEV